jgi:hypothetical protein
VQDGLREGAVEGQKRREHAVRLPGCCDGKWIRFVNDTKYADAVFTSSRLAPPFAEFFCSGFNVLAGWGEPSTC